MNKKYIHVSFDRVEKFVPKTYENTCPDEDSSIPHICVASTIGAALNAVPTAGFVLSYMRELNLPIILHVYYLTGSAVMENDEVQKYVPDADLTGETWLLKAPESVQRKDYMVTDFRTKDYIDEYGHEVRCICDMEIEKCEFQSNRENFLDCFAASGNRDALNDMFEKHSYRTILANIGEELIAEFAKDREEERE